jgi:shikimate dehydrogenase
LETAVSTTTAPLIINTTPQGMTPNEISSPWPDDLPFPDGTFVYDLVYNPRQTKLMRQAQAAGCGAANGLGMLVQQGALAFQLWTGVMPNVAIMKAEIRGQKAEN